MAIIRRHFPTPDIVSACMEIQHSVHAGNVTENIALKKLNILLSNADVEADIQYIESAKEEVVMLFEVMNELGGRGV